MVVLWGGGRFLMNEVPLYSSHFLVLQGYLARKKDYYRALGLVLQ